MAIAYFDNYPDKILELKLPKVKRFFRVDLDASTDDIQAGTFGFDKIPSNYRKICTSDKEALRNEYQPLSENILGKEYLPPWVSIRQGQTITLQLDWQQEKCTERFESVCFERHSDFTFEPENLKGAQEVKITCLRENENTAQILIKGDDYIAGGLNLFYPTPKRIDLRWAFVKISENDAIDLEDKVSHADLVAAFAQAFNPALIDIHIVNSEYDEIDNTSYLTKYKEEKRILFNGMKKSYYIHESARMVVINMAVDHNTNHKIADGINMYFFNYPVIDSTVIDNYEFKHSAGLSPTGTGDAYLVLEQNNKIESKNIVHEVMHAIGLQHTFSDKNSNDALKPHIFKIKKTKNYMDYNLRKEQTYFWQWKQLYNSQYSN